MAERGTAYEGTPPPSGGRHDGRRLALVIGNANYSSDHDALANPHNDARSIAAALTRIGFTGVRAVGADAFAVDFASPGVEPQLDLNNQRLGRALAALGRAAPGTSQAVIYYAGHGIELNGENYLIPTDANLLHMADAEFETQAASRALRAIEGAVGLRLVILDACRNSPFRTRLFGARDLGSGLRSIEPPGNVLVAYAAKHGTTARDGKEGGNSPFATALLKHIETPGLEVVDLFREVKDDVLEATEHAQEPFLYGSVGRRREYFVPPRETPPAPDPALELLTWSRLEWERLAHSGDAEQLRRFAEHAHAYYKHEAEVRIDALREAAARDQQAERRDVSADAGARAEVAEKPGPAKKKLALPPAKPRQRPREHEPTMEEILESIAKMIREDRGR